MSLKLLALLPSLASGLLLTPHDEGKLRKGGPFFSVTGQGESYNLHKVHQGEGYNLHKGCAPLVNQGTHFTIDVDVGTPPQRFSVVADTGSNNLIIPSCMCQENKICDASDRCFVGTKRSQTFALNGGPSAENVTAMTLQFGSGTITAVLAADDVKIGGLKTRMHDSLLLMVDKKLNFGGPFEGILGLGIPLPKNASAMAPKEEKAVHISADDQMKPIIDANGDLGDIVDQLKKAIEGMMNGGSGGAPSRVDTRMHSTRLSAAEASPLGNVGFLDEARVNKFTMCFNEESDGVLRLGNDLKKEHHGSFGSVHWGLGLNGISVGGRKGFKETQICLPNEKKEGQNTPCGIIPDSGTTLITGPEDQIGTLLGDICDNWDRCSKNYTTFMRVSKKAHEFVSTRLGRDYWGIDTEVKKPELLRYILSDCGQWEHDTSSNGFSGLPKLAFHVEGSNGTKETLYLPPEAYIYMKEVDAGEQLAKTGQVFADNVDNKPVAKNGQVFADHVQNNKTVGSGEKTLVCDIMFDVLDYQTAANGPVWIFGTPLFYKYQVGYNMNMNPPSMAFASVEDSPCGSCHAPTNAMSLTNQRRSGVRSIRRIHGIPRRPNIDTSRPF